jgi:integrase
MPISKGENPHHPKRYDDTKVDPIRKLGDIEKIKQLIGHHPRNLCLFVLGINTAYRANELLSIKVGQVVEVTTGDQLELKQSKNGRYRSVTLNESAVAVLQEYIQWKQMNQDDCSDGAPLFTGQRGRITVMYLNRLVKDWCRMIGLRGHFGSHTLRKTFGYQLRTQRDLPLSVLVDIFGHSSQKQTLAYLGIQDAEVQDAFLMLNL